MIASFSWRHKERPFVILEYAFAVRKTSHVRAGLLSATAIEGTICLNSTVTIESPLFFFLNNLFVMSFDYLSHVLSTTIAYFNGVFVKVFV